MILDSRGNPMHFRAGGYDGAVDSRKRDKGAFRRSLPYDEDHLVGAYDLDILRRQCLDLRRNNAIVAGVTERFADHVVGPNGITPQAKTDDPDWNEQAEEYWTEWSKIADHRQRVNLREIQRLAVQSRLLLGDSGYVLLASGQIQPIEAMRIASPAGKPVDGCVNGVNLSRSGIAKSFYVHARDKNGAISGKDWELVKSENMIFLTRPMRMDQVRTVPELAPILNAVTDFGRLQEETLNKATLDSMHAWAVYKDGGSAALANMGPRSYGSVESGETTGQKYETFEGGQTYYMNKDEKIESLASNTPNPQYVEYSRLLLQIMASSLSLPYEFLLLDFKQGSFSASRAALMTTYRTFSMWQTWLIDGMMQRLWNWRIAKAIKAGDLPAAPIDKRGYSQWHKVQWATPRYDWIDPKAEAMANKESYLLGAETLTSIAKSKGKGSADDVFAEKCSDIVDASRRAAEANAKVPGLNLTWRDVIEVGNASLLNAKETGDSPDEN